MAVYVLLVVEDEEQAKDLVRDMNLFTRGSLLTPTYEHEVEAKVWGVWKKPTLFCACDGSGKKTATAYTRGLKWGWWVHRTCMRPTARWASGAQWFTVLGTNLLPRAWRPYPEEMSTTLESPAAWEDLIETEKSTEPS